jgi:hypothetical protein
LRHASGSQAGATRVFAENAPDRIQPFGPRVFVELGRFPQCDIHIKWKLFRLRFWRKRNYDSRMALMPQISSKIASAADGQIRNQEIDSEIELPEQLGRLQNAQRWKGFEPGAVQ